MANVPFTRQDIEANRDFLAAWLRSVRAMHDVVDWAKSPARDPEFVLLDVRSRDAFAKGHIPGAASVPLVELEALAARLPRDAELVTYCGGGT